MGILTPMRQSKQRQRPQKSGLTPKKAASSPEGLFSPFSILFILILWSCAGHTASPKGEQHARRRATSGASGRALSAAKGERGGRQYRKEFQIDFRVPKGKPMGIGNTCLLYTSDAADDLLCVDLGGRRIIKKKKKII